MTTVPIPAPDRDAPSLSIGDVAERSGVSPGTVRIWETRHGFPEPTRLASGHRRYSEADADAVREVALLRDSGVRLDVAIARVRAAGGRADAAGHSVDSVYARLRGTHPGLHPSSLSKQTLLAMSWAIEDEFAAQARPAHLFGAFQRVQHFEAARSRWTDLGRQAFSAYVFADFEAVAGERLVEVPLPPEAPMLREWSVVCDSPGLAVALTARELPGQDRVHDRNRSFECLWTVDPAPVREAARVCAGLAAAVGAPGAHDVADELADPVSGSPDLAALTSLFNRSISYVDRHRAGLRPV